MNKLITSLRTFLSIPVFIAAIGTSNTLIAQDNTSFSGETKDAWITGKLESAYLLNEHLNSFNIDIETENGAVTLSGTVESEIDKELAGRIAEGLDGVTEVNNTLQVDTKQNEQPETSGNQFGSWVTDATIVAVIKSKLIANEHIDGFDINVDAQNGVVSLQGTVQSEEAKDLAGTIAKNANNVTKVENNLKVTD